MPVDDVAQDALQEGAVDPSEEWPSGRKARL